MSIICKGVESYKGAVYGDKEHYYLDGMLEEMALVWDIENHKTEIIDVGYYGSDCRNLYDCHYKIDIDQETARDMIRTYKKLAIAAYAESVTAEKQAVKKNSNCEVVRGRKIKKGTKVKVFWVGEKETYLSKQYSWMNEKELIAGCYTENGEKIWIKAEYLKVTDKISSPKRSEREKYIKWWIRENVPHNVHVAAMN